MHLVATGEQAEGEDDTVYQSVFEAFVKYCCQSSRSHLVNEELGKISFACAVDLLIDGRLRSNFLHHRQSDDDKGI
jgi:hypothetical protein